MRPGGGPRAPTTMACVSEYPVHLETDVVLRDGSTVRIRPRGPRTPSRVEDYLIGLSDETRRLRFWGPSVDIRGWRAKAVDVDYVDHLTLLAFTGGDGGRGRRRAVHPDGRRRAPRSA